MGEKVKISGASKTYKDARMSVHALNQVNLEFGDGDFICLVGPSGCGKSTLLNVLAGFEQLDSGSLHIFGEEPCGPSIERTMVFQEYALFPWMTVAENIEYGLRHKSDLSRPERKDLIKYYLSLIELENFESKYPHQLSGGMRQRVAIARALAVKPRMLLMDEPFAALDSFTREKMQDELLKILSKEKTCVVFVTHSIEEALKLADQIVVMSPRPGRIVREIQIEKSKPRAMTDPYFVELGQEIRCLLHDSIE